MDFADRHARVRSRDREAGADHALVVAYRHGKADNAREKFLIVYGVAALADLVELAMQRIRVGDCVLGVAGQWRRTNQFIAAPARLHAEQKVCRPTCSAAARASLTRISARRARRLPRGRDRELHCPTSFRSCKSRRLLRQRFQYSVAWSRPHRGLHGAKRKIEQPGTWAVERGGSARVAAGLRRRAGARCGAWWASAPAGAPPVPRSPTAAVARRWFRGLQRP